MKKFLFFALSFSVLTGFSQTENRVEIEGEIKVPESVNPSGITVFNTNSADGTITNDLGQFSIAVAVNDSLVFSSVQFQAFTVVVDKGVVGSGKLNVEVKEAVTELAEVVVRPYDLTGNVRVDVAGVENRRYFESQISPSLPDHSIGAPEVENYALNNDDVIEGLNLINLFKLVFNDKNYMGERNNEVSQQPVEVLIRKIYKDEFFQKYMDIEEERIDDFIAYAEKKGLSQDMFAKGKELDLIEFLIEKSKEFKHKTN